MRPLARFLTQLWDDESGISSVEYALLLAFVAAGIILGAEFLSDAVEGEMKTAANCIQGTSTASC